MSAVRGPRIPPGRCQVSACQVTGRVLGAFSWVVRFADVAVYLSCCRDEEQRDHCCTGALRFNNSAWQCLGHVVCCNSIASFCRPHPKTSNHILSQHVDVGRWIKSRLGVALSAILELPVCPAAMVVVPSHPRPLMYSTPAYCCRPNPLPQVSIGLCVWD